MKHDKRRILKNCILKKLQDLKEKKYSYFIEYIGKQWFEEVIHEGIKIRLEIEISYDYCMPDSKDIRVTLIADDYSLFSFIRSQKGSFSITPLDEIMA